MLSCGIVGLPNVGKSTLFNALTKSAVAAENYPFCTIDPNVGVVPVPDNRLNEISKFINPKKIVPTSFEFVDIAGLVKGASTGEGLGNQFLAHIRNVNAIAHIVRCFEEKDVIHTCGSPDAIRDVEIINTELILSDLSSLEKRVLKIERKAKSGDKESEEELKVLKNMKEKLNQGITIHNMRLPLDDFQKIKECSFLTSKPVIYVANVGEKDLANPENNPEYLKLKTLAEKEEAEICAISAKIEAEIAQLPDEEVGMFLENLGVTERGLDRLIRKAYHLLNFITYFTAGEVEVRAWTITKGANAQKSAGEIHSDIEKGFIRAETVSYKDFIECQSIQNAKNKGLLRLEGKEYIVNDGDIIYFRFNVSGSSK